MLTDTRVQTVCYHPTYVRTPEHADTQRWKNRGSQDWSRSRTKSSCFWAQCFCLRWWHSRDGSRDGFMPLWMYLMLLGSKRDENSNCHVYYTSVKKDESLWFVQKQTTGAKSSLQLIVGTLLHGVGWQAQQSGQANLDYLPQWGEKFAPNTLVVFKNCFTVTHLQIPLSPQWLSCFLPPHAWLILSPRSFSFGWVSSHAPRFLPY